MDSHPEQTETRPVVEFDHHSAEYIDRSSDIFREIRAKCPVAWSEEHGGFWVLSRHADVAEVARDPERFSSDFDPEGTRSGYGGVHIPPHSPASGRFVPEECDPPESVAYRHIVNAEFSPEAVEKLEPLAEDLVTYCIDRRIETGEMDLVLDIASPVPAMLTMHLFGVPLEGWERWAEPLHSIIGERPGTPEHDNALLGVGGLMGDLGPLIADRRARPGDDLVSRVVHGTVDGKPLTDDVIMSFLFTLLAGGVDTTTSLLGHAFVWLGDHPDDRQRLIADPDLLPSACEEFLRWSSPNNMVARTATTDTTVRGQTVRAGERVMLCYASANRDEEVFDRGDEFVLDRSPNRHVSFGMGVHRCLGANLARMEFKVIMREILRRLPDYQLVPGGSVRYPETCVIDGWLRVPATFTPGPKVGSSLALEAGPR